MKRAKLDFCWGCGAPTPLRCARCKKPVCVVWGSPTPAVGCATLRKAPGKVGVFLLVCTPRCRLRRSPNVIAVIEKHKRPSAEKLRSELDDALFAATQGHPADCPCTWCARLAERLAEIKS